MVSPVEVGDDCAAFVALSIPLETEGNICGLTLLISIITPPSRMLLYSIK